MNNLADNLVNHIYDYPIGDKRRIGDQDLDI